MLDCRQFRQHTEKKKVQQSSFQAHGIIFFMRQKNLKIHNNSARSAPSLGLGPFFGVTRRLPQTQAFWTARVSTSPSSIRKPKAILESFGSLPLCHYVTWTPGLEEETRRTSAFPPLSLQLLWQWRVKAVHPQNVNELSQGHCPGQRRVYLVCNMGLGLKV